MESLVSLEGCEPELREYLERHRWPSVMEALLTGLTVMTPRDPWQFVCQSLMHIRDASITDIPRDLFIDPASRGVLQRGCLRGLHLDSDAIDEEQLELAHRFRSVHLFRWCFRAWLQYHEQERVEQALFRERLRLAERHYRCTISSKLIHSWRDYNRMKRFRRHKASGVLSRMHQRRLLGRLLAVWRRDAVDSLQTRAFFDQQREREAEGEGWTWPEGKDHLSLMDRAVSLKIFRDVGVRGLVACSRVCRTWRDLVGDPQLWNRIDLSTFTDKLRDSRGLEGQLHRRRAVLGHLCLRGCSSLSPDSLKIIGECHNLQDLNLSECAITDDVMEIVTRGCSGLLYLNLSHCYVTDTTIRTLASRCGNLNHLSLAGCLHFTSRGLRYIQRGKGCRRLVYLDLSGCTKLTAEALQCIGVGCPILNTVLLDHIPSLSDSMIMNTDYVPLNFVAMNNISLASSTHTLRHISLLTKTGTTLSISDRSVKSLVQHNRKLRTLKIENGTVLTDVSLRVLSRGCRDLHYLHLAGCSRLSDKGLSEVKRLKKLSVLNIADCTRVSDLGVRHIAESSFGPTLRELNLTNCQKLSDISLLRLTPACPALSHLSLAYCHHISDTGVELLSQLPLLYSLDLSGCSLTDQGVASLHGNPKLRHLGLAELPEITDDGVKRMCRGLQWLETLDLSECEALTSQALQTLAYHCHYLRHLHISSCYNVRDDGVKYLSKGCTYLTHLDLSGCVITDRALQCLRKSCLQLKSLNVLCCVNITREEVQRYRKKGVSISYNTDRPDHFNQSQGISGLSHLETEQLINRI